jgi:hypothetical protein
LHPCTMVVQRGAPLRLGPTPRIRRGRRQRKPLSFGGISLFSAPVQRQIGQAGCVAASVGIHPAKRRERRRGAGSILERGGDGSSRVFLCPEAAKERGRSRPRPWLCGFMNWCWAGRGRRIQACAASEVHPLWKGVSVGLKGRRNSGLTHKPG